MRLLFIIALLIATCAQAQIYPVQVNVQLTPPYSPYLSDYTQPGSRRLSVHVFANDHTLVDYPCRLRLTVEGSGITLRTRDDFAGPPLHITGGNPHTWYGDDLAAYFNPDALDFNGISRPPSGAIPRLPEGIYRFTVEILDYYRGTIVSNTATATAWIILNDPPLLNTPANASTISLQDPVNILFSWAPRHTTSPNAAFTTVYDFRLVECWPDDRHPGDAILSQRPLYATTVDQPQLLYGPGEPPLLPGRKYAWQVTARDVEGRDLFKHQGRSEIFTFRFGLAMPPPAQVFLRWAKPTTLAIRWTAVDFPQPVRYRLQYRPRHNRTQLTWYEHWTRFTDKTIYHLSSNTEYEVRLRTENDLQESEYGPIQIYKTLPPEAEPFVCRDVPPPPPPHDSPPVFPLAVNDTIHAGGYQVLVRDVAQVGTRYHGSGLAIIPWLNEVRVPVTFESIRVNDRFWLTSGTIHSRWKATSNSLLQFENPPESAEVPVVQTGQLNITVASTDSLIAVEEAAIVSVSLDDNGDVVVVTSDGGQQTLEAGTRYALTDAVGNGYVVDANGNIAKTTAAQAQATRERGRRTYDIKFRFHKGVARYGFDEFTYSPLRHFYQEENGEVISWKALSDSRPDAVEGRYESADGNTGSLRFRLGDTPVSPLIVVGNEFTLNIAGRAHGWEEELVALEAPSDTIPPVVVGKINTVTYRPQHFQLVLVPVNGTSLPAGLTSADVANHLNNVYSQAVVTWSVTTGEAVHTQQGETVDVTSRGAFSSYTNGMKAILRAYGRFQQHVFYLFLANRSTDPDLLGYMPRSRPAGFVFVDPHSGDNADFLKTIAHELGHGAFNLRHPFQSFSLPVGTTDNLMDYSDGLALNKYQWDQIHNPAKVVGLFEDDEEGELNSLAFQQFATALQGDDARKALEELRTVYDFFNQCKSEGWVSYKGAGLIPYCLWRNAAVPTSLHYSFQDTPFQAGLIDGGYQEVEGLIEFIVLLLRNNLLGLRLLTTYTVGDWYCSEDELRQLHTQHRIIVEELARLEAEEGLWAWVQRHWFGKESEKKLIEDRVEYCNEAIELRANIAELYELVTNWEEIKGIAQTVIKEIEEYLDVLSEEDNTGRYERGRLVIPVASVVVPGIGAATKVTRIKRGLSALSKAPKETLGRFAREVFGVNPRIASIMSEMNAAGKFRRLRALDGKYYNAADFWKSSDPAFKIVASSDGKYVLKHDPSTGRVIFADVEERRFLSFALDEDKMISGDYENVLRQMRTIHGLPGGSSSVVVKGKHIPLARDKPNVILGKYDPNSVPGVAGEIGTDDIIRELGILKNYSFADDVFELRPGSIHVLNIPSAMVEPAAFFDRYNKPFLDVILRNPQNTEVLLVTDPRKSRVLRVFNPKNDEITRTATGYAREIRYLRENGIQHARLVNGETIDLNTLDLGDLIW